MRACFLAFQLVLTVLGVLLASGRAEAYPWMIKHGYTVCATCHSDPSGGELLTGYGRLLSKEVLSTHWHGAEGSGASETAPNPPASTEEGHEFYQPFFGLVGEPESLLLGGSLRMATLFRDGDKVRAFPMQIDLYGDYTLFRRLHLGGSLGVAKVPVGSPHARAAQITTNQGDGFNLLSRTHYVRFDLGEGNYTITAGRLNLPFGVRMSEHVMWVRSETATDRESDQQHGVALNMDFDSWRFELMAIAGNYQLNPDKLRKRGYSAYAEFSGIKGVAFGASSLITHAGSDMLNPTPLTDTRQAHGAFVRADLGRELVLMAEADLLLHTQTKPGYVGFAQLDFEAFNGLHVIGTGEVLDSGYPKTVSEDVQPRIPGVGKAKLGGWLSTQWFFVAHFDFRLDAIVRQSEPFQLLGQLHVYL